MISKDSFLFARHSAGKIPRWDVTTLKTNPDSYKWTILTVVPYLIDYQIHRSRIFGTEELKLQLSIQLRNEIDSQKVFHVYLHRCISSTSRSISPLENIRVSYHITVYLGNQKISDEKGLDIFRSSESPPAIRTNIIKVGDDFPTSGLETSLTIICNFYTAYKEQIHTLLDNNVSIFGNIKKTNNEKIKNYRRLLMDGAFSDVDLISHNKTIKAHKFILSANSPVFWAMFESDMKEKRDNVFNVPDEIEYEVLLEALNYMYFSRCNVKHYALELLVISDMYDIIGLKRTCEDYLITRLDCDNAKQYHEISVRYQAKELQALSLNLLKISPLVMQIENKNSSLFNKTLDNFILLFSKYCNQIILNLFFNLVSENLTFV